jgi:H-NS histone family
MVKPDMLDALSDDELKNVIKLSEELLKKRDAERKAKALTDARTLLASVGLSLKDIGGKAQRKGAPLYKGGRLYQHPENKALIWKANGQKPNWLRELEGRGGKAVAMQQEMENERGKLA